MVSANSNISFYGNIYAGNTITKPAEHNSFNSELSNNNVYQEMDAFELTPFLPDDSYSEKIQSNLKQNKKVEHTKSEQLSPEEKKEQEKLEKTDQKVRAHEQAHLAAGAGLVRGGASFEYTRGPDGKMYAVGGEVKIDISPVPGKPDQTIRKMERVIAAALAPVDPSPQDRMVATLARNIQSKARMEKSEELRKDTSEISNLPNQNTNSSKPKADIIPNANNEKESNDINNVSKSRVIKQYFINNPYQNLDRIIYRSV